MGEAPANLCTPAYVAGAAQSIAAAAPDVMRLEVLSAEDCAARGMGLFLAVARGSTANPPHFVHLTYTPKGGEDCAISASFVPDRNLEHWCVTC